MKGRTQRRGYALIEMLVVISGMAILFGMSVGMIHMLLRLDRGNRARLGEKTTISRLAQDVRRDAHMAGEARGIESKGRTGVALDLGEGRVVEYVDEDGRLVRHEAAGTGTPKHEVYRLPSRGRSRIALREEGPQRWLVITLEPSTKSMDSLPARPIVVEASVGKHRRLADLGESRP